MVGTLIGRNIMDSNGANDFMFATQTHVMSEELLYALDYWVYDVPGPKDEMRVWFEDLFKAINSGDEFTVTAAQAQWIIAVAQEGLEGFVPEEGCEEDYQCVLDEIGLINETFDDYANFLRTNQNGDLDIFSIFGQFKEE